MKLKEKIKLIKNWNLNAVPPNNIQWLDNATDKEIQNEWEYWTQEENPYENKLEQNGSQSGIMNREQEDRLLEDYIETLRDESNWSVSFSDFKDREKTRAKEFK